MHGWAAVTTKAPRDADLSAEQPATSGAAARLRSGAPRRRRGTAPSSLCGLSEPHGRHCATGQCRPVGCKVIHETARRTEIDLRSICARGAGGRFILSWVNFALKAQRVQQLRDALTRWCRPDRGRCTRGWGGAPFATSSPRGVPRNGSMGDVPHSHELGQKLVVRRTSCYTCCICCRRARHRAG